MINGWKLSKSGWIHSINSSANTAVRCKPFSPSWRPSRDELLKVENISTQIREVEEKLGKIARNQLTRRALELSRKRAKTAKKLALKVVAELGSLKMSQTEFQAVLHPVAADEKTNAYLTTKEYMITEAGIDRATFMIAPNPGEELKPLASIASGGELSRVVLALKAILAATDAVETIVFDEVDAGIGGGTAEVVGRKLSELARAIIR